MRLVGAGGRAVVLWAALAASSCLAGAGGGDPRVFSMAAGGPAFEVPADAVIYVDGLRQDMLAEMAAAGELPRLHGGLEREELLVPLYFAGPGIHPGRELWCARLVDVVPTILELRGMPAEEL
jgi:hypothetical protein